MPRRGPWCSTSQSKTSHVIIDVNISCEQLNLVQLLVFQYIALLRLQWDICCQTYEKQICGVEICWTLSFSVYVYSYFFATLITFAIKNSSPDFLQTWVWHSQQLRGWLGWKGKTNNSWLTSVSTPSSSALPVSFICNSPSVAVPLCLAVCWSVCQLCQHVSLFLLVSSGMTVLTAGLWMLANVCPHVALRKAKIGKRHIIASLISPHSAETVVSLSR